MAFDSGDATWFRTSLDKDGRLEPPPPPPGIPLTLVIEGTVAAWAEDDVALRPLLALTPVPVLTAPLLSADPRGLGSVPGLNRKKINEGASTERVATATARDEGRKADKGEGKDGRGYMNI